MLLHILAAAAALSLPNIPQKVAFDFGRKVLVSLPRGQRLPTGRIELFSAPSGKVIDCRMKIVADGNSHSEKEICRLFRNKTIEPANGSDGKTEFGLVRFNFQPDGGAVLSGHDEPQAFPADLTLRVNKLPPNVDRALRIPFKLQVAEDGTVQDCVSANTENPQLVSIGCAQAIGRGMPVRTDSDGHAVPYVAPFDVDFTTEQLPQG